MSVNVDIFLKGVNAMAISEPTVVVECAWCGKDVLATAEELSFNCPLCSKPLRMWKRTKWPDGKYWYTMRSSH